MTRIGLIEDSEDFREEMAFQLSREGFQIALQSDGRDIDAQLAQSPCDIIVLDLGLPKEDGLSIARRLRKNQPGLGIVMVTARGSIEARLLGLDEGADAYLVKPAHMRELASVLRSLERRLASSSKPQGAWQISQRNLTLTAPSGTRIRLTAREVELLLRLGEAGSLPVARKELILVLGESELSSDERRLEVAMSRLRQKIEECEPESDVIRSVRGHGYLFAAELSPAS